MERVHQHVIFQKLIILLKTTIRYKIIMRAFYQNLFCGYGWKYKGNNIRSVVYLYSLYNVHRFNSIVLFFVFSNNSRPQSASWLKELHNFLPSPFSLFPVLPSLLLCTSYTFEYSMKLTWLPFLYFCLMIHIFLVVLVISFYHYPM